MVERIKPSETPYKHHYGLSEKRSLVEIAFRIRKIWVIKYVEELSSNLQRPVFRQAELSMKRKVELSRGKTAQSIPSERSLSG